MAKAKIEWENIESVLAAIREWPQIFDEEILLTLRLIGELLRSATVIGTPTGTGASPWGHLANAIGVNEPYVRSGGWIIEYGLPAGHGYGAVIEYGRTPGSRQPPLEAITAWIWGKRHVFPEVESEEDAQKLAYPIARHIAKYGFSTASDGPGKGWSMFEKAQKESMETIDRVLDDMRDRISRRCSENG